jgi:hypothetical protein
MQNLLEGISVEGIIKPGEIYVFTESEDRLDEIEGPDISYTIRSDDELMAALEMEVFTVLPDWYDIKEFIGWERISEDCYRFRFSCDPNEQSRKKIHSLYLHRMIRVSERLEWVKSHFENRDAADSGESNYD